MTTPKITANIVSALGTKKSELLRFQFALNANPALRSKFLRAPDVTLREAGFEVSQNTAALLTSAVREALDRHGNADPRDIDVNITTRVSLASRPTLRGKQ